MFLNLSSIFEKILEVFSEPFEKDFIPKCFILSTLTFVFLLQNGSAKV